MRMGLFQRAGGAPSAPPEALPEGPVADAMAGRGITCPACGMQLADTPENRAYVAAQGEDMAANAGDDDESGED